MYFFGVFFFYIEVEIMTDVLLLVQRLVFLLFLSVLFLP